jgi:hypothetical protein
MEAITIYELVETRADVGFTIHILTTDAAFPYVGMVYSKGSGAILGCKGRKYSRCPPFSRSGAGSC